MSAALPLAGKNYAIAGGSSGIGLALVEQLENLGAHVYVYSRAADQLLVSPQILHTACDFVTDEFSNVSMPDELHGAAYCPGTIQLKSFRSLNVKDAREDFELNVLGAIKFLKGCLNGLKKGGNDHPASIVLFSTVAVGLGLPMHSSIAMAKGAIEGLTRTLAAELAPQIRVNCVAPALTDTPLAAKFLDSPEKRRAMDARYPLGRIGQPDDVAALAGWLLQPSSGWVTGQVIGVDGGMSQCRTGSAS